MVIIEYDHSPNISPEQGLRSLADSVRRAFEELDAGLENYADKKHNHIISDITDLKLGDIASSIEELRELKGAIHRRSKSISGYSFTAKQYRSISIPYDVVEGYTPIVYLVACTSHSAIRVFNYYTSSGNVVFEAVNQNDTSLTASFSIYFFYIKNVLMG